MTKAGFHTLWNMFRLSGLSREFPTFPVGSAQAGHMDIEYRDMPMVCKLNKYFVQRNNFREKLLAREMIPKFNRTSVPAA